MRLRTIGTIILFITGGTFIAETGSDTTSLCVLQETVPAGAHHEVVVSGLYARGPEHATLTDSPCPGQRTWIELDLRKGENEKTLQDSLGDIRLAYVVFQGEFYGPPLLDPSIPDAIAKALHPPRWGHLGCCKTQLVVHRILNVKPLVKESDFPDCSVVVTTATIPKYPEAALAAQVQGDVHIRVTLNKDGTVGKAETISGDPVLVPAALEAAKNWFFGSASEKPIDLEFHFVALPSNDPNGWIGSVFESPFTVMVFDRFPVKPSSP